MWLVGCRSLEGITCFTSRLSDEREWGGGGCFQFCNGLIMSTYHSYLGVGFIVECHANV